MEDRYIATVDLGSAKTAFAVARINGDAVEVLHYKERPSDGIRNGKVINPAKASVPVKDAIRDAEEELGIKISQVVVGLPRYPIVEESATANLDRTSQDPCISREEVDDLKNYALDSYKLDDDKRQEIYGAVVLSYSTDDYIQSSEEDIVGVASENLKGNFKVLVGERKASDNIDTMAAKAGTVAARKYFVPDMVARAVLTRDELDSGVALIEIGAGVSSVTVYRGGVLQHYRSIPFGGRNITEDIRNECGFSEKLAENVKYAFGACMPEKLQSLGEKTIQIENEDGSCDKLPVRYLSEIITERAREIIEALLYDIQKNNCGGMLRSGIVLTGGCANLANLGNLIKDISGLNVRIGYPRGKEFSTSGCSGINGTGAVGSLGMILHARTDRYFNCVTASSGQEAAQNVQETVVAAKTDRKSGKEEKKVAEEEEKVRKELEGSVFDTRTGINPEARKSGRKGNNRAISWFKKNVVESVGDLYDQTH